MAMLFLKGMPCKLLTRLPRENHVLVASVISLMVFGLSYGDWKMLVLHMFLGMPIMLCMYLQNWLPPMSLSLPGWGIPHQV
jgi:hypothetical protein